MAGLGEADRAFLEEFVYPRLGATRDDVRLGPRGGMDFGVIDVGESVVALATDPVFVVPSLGFERAARFATHVLLSDVAVSGIPPSHLSIDLNLPPEMTDAEFATLWERIDAEAADLGVSVVTGHTGRYEGCSYPMVGSGTALAAGDPADLVRPDGARIGDRVVVTKGPAIEATGILSNGFEALVRGEVPDATVDAAMARLSDTSSVRDAMTAAAAGRVTAMHGAREGGVVGGLAEMARSAGVGIEVETDRIPVLPGVRAACDCFDIDPWISISEGTLLVTVDPDDVEDVLSAFESVGIPAGDAGVVVEGSGLVVDGEPVEPPDRDPFWAAFAEHAQQL